MPRFKKPYTPSNKRIETVLCRAEIICGKLGIATIWRRGPASSENTLVIGSYGWTGAELVLDAGIWDRECWYDPFHEIGHWLVAGETRRKDPRFELTNGTAAEDQEEITASALGIWLHRVLGKDRKGALEHAIHHSWDFGKNTAFGNIRDHLRKPSVEMTRARALLSAAGLAVPYEHELIPSANGLSA